MEKEFVPYELAVKLKELGFDEPCLASYETAFGKNGPDFQIGYIIDGPKNYVLVPTFSQAFRWFREKHELTSEVCVEQYRRKTNKKWMFSITYLNKDAMYEHSKTTFETYEKAELACLEKLIEIVKTK